MSARRLGSRFWACAVGVALATAAYGCAAPMKVAKLIVSDRDKTLRERPKDAAPNAPERPGVLFLAFDGVDRSLLYDMLKRGELPHLAELLGGAGTGGSFPHAHFDETLLSTLPSSTLAAWTTVVTGVAPGVHGVTGNEFFIREERRLAAPAPVSFSDSKPTLAMYTDDYVNAMLHVPTVYERIREVDPNVLQWVAMHQVYRGADRLLVATPAVMAKAFESVFEDIVKKGVDQEKPTRTSYEKLDGEVVHVVDGALSSGPVPDVLTVYLSGTDLYAHIAEEGPNDARRGYLREVFEPAISKLTNRLRERGALANRYVVITADHGHTAVMHDEDHALPAKGGEGPPPMVMKKAGYRVRPFKLDVSEKDDFDAVLAEGGATAYVYVADRSTCPRAKDVCDWKKPPRYEADVLPMADAFYESNRSGAFAPEMKDKLDLVLTRKPKPYSDVDAPFEVYVGGGKTMPVAEYLAKHPHPTYVMLEERLRDLAVGPHGERAGDVMLIAHNGDRAQPEERFYFASLYRSWHGSPSKQDSEVPLIVAHPQETAATLHARVTKAIGPHPRQQKVAELIFQLREGRPSAAP